MKWTMLTVMLMVTGCTSYEARIGDANIKMNYLLQDKKFKSVSFNPSTGAIVIENFGSETSEIVASAITAALAAREKGGE